MVLENEEYRPLRAAALLAALAAETPAPAPGPEWDPHGPDPEPRYAPVFIRNASYGTRCSTIVAIDNAGHGTIIERRFLPGGEVEGDTTLTFRWPASHPAR